VSTHCTRHCELHTLCTHYTLNQRSSQSHTRARRSYIPAPPQRAANLASRSDADLGGCATTHCYGYTYILARATASHAMFPVFLLCLSGGRTRHASHEHARRPHARPRLRRQQRTTIWIRAVRMDSTRAGRGMLPPQLYSPSRFG